MMSFHDDDIDRNFAEVRAAARKSRRKSSYTAIALSVALFAAGVFMVLDGWGL